MTRKIWKYELSSHGPTVVESREGAHPISAMFDASGMLSAWMTVDPGAVAKSFTFYTVFTGEAVPEKAVFLGTEVWRQQGLVFHIFYRSD